MNKEDNMKINYIINEYFESNIKDRKKIFSKKLYQIYQLLYEEYYE